MEITIDPNPNCSESGQFVFNEIGNPDPIDAILATTHEGEQRCDVVAVHPGGVFGPAMVRRVQDSGEGVAYLIYGGLWGIRLRPSAYGLEPWDLKNTRQWGEAFKIYGSLNDIFLPRIV